MADKYGLPEMQSRLSQSKGREGGGGGAHAVRQVPECVRRETEEGTREDKDSSGQKYIKILGVEIKRKIRT